MGHNFLEVEVLDSARAVAVIFMHEVENFLLFDIKAKSTHGDFELVVVNSAGFISVKEVEGFLDFLLLLFRELLSCSALGLARNHLAAIIGLLGSEVFRLLVHFFFNLNLN